MNGGGWPARGDYGLFGVGKLFNLGLLLQHKSTTTIHQVVVVADDFR